MAICLWTCNKSYNQHELTSIIVIEQNQTPYQNGKNHGEILQAEIHRQIQNWEEGISAHLNISHDSMYNIVYKHTEFFSTIQEHHADLLEEINGIADGAGMDRKRVLIYNLGEEIYNFCTAHFESCSNISFSGNGIQAMAYNQDLPNFLHGNNKVIVLKYDKQVIFTMPGCIALSGLSQHVAVSCNSLPMLKMNREGLPLPFFIRQLLLANSMEEAQRAVKNTALAIPQNLMLLGNTGIKNAEISKNQIKWLPVEKGFLQHTNFPIQNTDYKNKDYHPSDCMRYAYLDSMTLEIQNQPTPNMDEKLKMVFGKSPILNPDTFLRFIAKYSPNKSVNCVLINPATHEEYSINF